jgi:ABC-type multidrug transport system permease subunit
VLREFIAAVIKNVKRLTRSRMSLFALLFGPLLLMLIVGIAFTNARLQGITIGAYIPEHTPAIDGVIAKLNEQKQTFAVREFKTNESCVQSVKEGDTHLCMTLLSGGAGGSGSSAGGAASGAGGPGGSVGTPDGKVDVVFYVDYSRLSLVYVMLNAMNQQISNQAAQIGTDVSRGLLDRVVATNQYAAEHAGALDKLAQQSSAMRSDLAAAREQLAKIDLTQAVDASQIDAFSTQIAAQQKLLAQQETEVRSQVDDAQAQLGELSDQLDDTESALTKDRTSIDTMLTQTGVLYTGMGCSGANVEDLTPYLQDNETFARELAAQDRPECSLVYTTRLNLQGIRARLDTALTQLRDGRERIDDARGQLDGFEKAATNGTRTASDQLSDANDQLDKLRSDVADGQERLVAVRAQRDALLTRLLSAESTIESSSSVLVKAREDLSKVQSQLADVSAVTPEAIVRPFATNVRSLSTKSRQIDFLFPTLILLIVMFVAILAASMLVIKERSSHAYFRNLIIPSALPTLFLSILATGVALSLLQVGVLLVIGSLVFDIAILSVLPSVLLIALAAAVLFAMIGMCYGFLFVSEETTTLISILTGVVLFMFSSSLSPVESMNPAIAGFVKFNPFYLLDTVLRRSLVLGEPLSMSRNVIVLLIEIVILAVLVALVVRRARKNF